MTLSLENAILLPGEKILWQGPGLHSFGQNYPHYYLTDERLLVHSSKTSYKSFDLSQLAATEYETLKDCTLITITPFKGEVPFITLKLPPNSAEIYQQLEAARAKAIANMLAEGEQIGNIVRISGPKFLIYKFLKQNSVLLFFFCVTCGLSFFSVESTINTIWPIFILVFPFFLINDAYPSLGGKFDTILRRLILGIKPGDKLVVSRKIATLSLNMVIYFWCIIVFLFFVGFLLFSTHI